MARSCYSHFNKIIKGSGTSFQSPALRQKHVRSVCQTAHCLTKFHFDSLGFKRNKPKCKFHHEAICLG